MEKNLLVMRLSAMGDVAMTVPVVASFLNAYPDVHLIFLSNPKLESLFSQYKNLTFIPIDTKKEYAGNLGMYKLYKKLKKQYHFDAMIDLHDVLRSKLLRTLFRIGGVKNYVIKKGRKEKKALTSADKKLTQLKSSIQRYQDVFAEAGYPFQLLKNDYFSTKHFSVSTALNELIENKKKNWIGIAPFAQHQGKIYPIEKTEEIVAYFSKEYSHKAETQLLLFGGGPQEKKILDQWAITYPNTIALAGKFKLEEEMILIQQCNVLLSMDSANMHLASLVGTPVVSIWGATHPYAGFYGYQQDPQDIVQADLPCRPCSIYGNKPCQLGDYRCMTTISTEQVIDKLSKHIERNQK